MGLEYGPWQWKCFCSCVGSKLVHRSAVQPGHLLPMVQISFHVGWASNANHKIRGSKVITEKHGAHAMGIHGNHSVSWRETGASRFRPTQRSVNCCNIASFLHKTCKATSLPIIVCCVQRMQHAQRVSTFTADAQLLPRVFAPSLMIAARKPVN